MGTKRRQAAGSSSLTATAIDRREIATVNGPLRTEKGSNASIKGARVVPWSEIEHWQQDNEYIRHGYRPASYSFRRSLASLLYLHNESVNIHTHLSAGLLFAGLAFYFYAWHYHQNHNPDHQWMIINFNAWWLHSEAAGKPTSPWIGADLLAFGCFFAGVIFCLLMSATYHAISNHSLLVAQLGNKLDYVGIVLLIWGSFTSSVYYGFYGERFWQQLYWGMITAIGIGCAITSTLPRFRTPIWRPFRAAMFVGMGLSAIVPVLHGLGRWGIEGMRHRIGLEYIVSSGLLYIGGAALYAARIPEKWRPGAFDIWGSSHQIFHMLVNLAALAHWLSLLKASAYAHAHSHAS